MRPCQPSGILSEVRITMMRIVEDRGGSIGEKEIKNKRPVTRHKLLLMQSRTPTSSNICALDSDGS